MCASSRRIEKSLGFGRMRGGDHDEIAGGEQGWQVDHSGDRFDSRGHAPPARDSDRPHATFIPNATARRAISAPIAPKPTIPIRQSGKNRVARSMALTTPGPAAKLTRVGLPAAGRPAPVALVTDVHVQITGEAQDVAHHLVGDHVAEKAPGVRQGARVFDKSREHVMLQARRERLDPAKAVG